ncbi:MAG: UpxY family transcription antiterminator [Parabacteroides sp.]
MAHEQHKEIEQWYVMRAYKNEKRAEELLSGKHGLKHFIPKQQVIRTCNGKKIISMVPVIRSLVFVYATQKQIVKFKRSIYNDLQFVIWKCDNELLYLTVPNKQMDHFILVCEQKEQEVVFYRPDQIQVEKGQRVRVHGGTFDKLEGIVVKVEKKRNRQFVVLVPQILAASVKINPEFLEILEGKRENEKYPPPILLE